MVKLNKTKRIFIIVIFFSIIFAFNISQAAEYSEINNKWFYIKNAYTGAYLDLVNGNGSPGTNVHQYEYNGSGAQAWFIQHMGNGEYMIATYCRFKHK